MSQYMENKKVPEKRKSCSKVETGREILIEVYSSGKENA